jgi:hypothetical protein
VVKGWGSVEAFERYVNSQPTRQLFSSRYVKYVAGRKVDLGESEVLVAGALKLVIDEPVRGDSLRLPTVAAVANASKDDRLEAFGESSIEEPVSFLGSDVDLQAPWDRLAERAAREMPATEQHSQRPGVQKAAVRPSRKRVLLPGGVEYYPLYDGPQYAPNKVRLRCTRFNEWFVGPADAKYCALCGEEFKPPLCPSCGGRLIPRRGVFCERCGVKLPSSLAVPVEVAVELQERLFLRLPQFQRDLVNAAYSRVAEGRDERRVRVGENVSVIHLQVRDEWAASTVEVLNRLHESLQEAGVGRVTTDPYELQLVRKRLALN